MSTNRLFIHNVVLGIGRYGTLILQVPRRKQRCTSSLKVSRVLHLIVVIGGSNDANISTAFWNSLLYRDKPSLHVGNGTQLLALW